MFAWLLFCKKVLMISENIHWTIVPSSRSLADNFNYSGHLLNDGFVMFEMKSIIWNRFFLLRDWFHLNHFWDIPNLTFLLHFLNYLSIIVSFFISSLLLLCAINSSWKYLFLLYIPFHIHLYLWEFFLLYYSFTVSFSMLFHLGPTLIFFTITSTPQI